MKTKEVSETPIKFDTLTLYRLMDDCLPEEVIDEHDMQRMIDKLWPALVREHEIVGQTYNPRFKRCALAHPARNERTLNCCYKPERLIMCNEVKALCIKRNQLEMQLERNEEKGGETITLTKVECEELFKVMRAAEEQIDNWLGHGL